MKYGFRVESKKRDFDEDSTFEPIRADSRPAAQRRNLTNSERTDRRKMKRTSSYSGPGYYLVNEEGQPQSERFDTMSQAEARLTPDSGHLMQFVAQEPGASHIAQPFPANLQQVNGSLMYTEADYLAAMAKATPNESMQLMGELEKLRAESNRKIQADKELDMSNAYIDDVMTPVAVHEHVTASTDWMETLTEPRFDNNYIKQAMVAEASEWFNRTSPEVREDVEEFAEQAKGYARRVSSALGGYDGDFGYKTFMFTAGRLLKQTEMTPYPAALPTDTRPIQHHTTQWERQHYSEKDHGKLCPSCKGNGCDKCQDTGYAGGREANLASLEDKKCPNCGNEKMMDQGMGFAYCGACGNFEKSTPHGMQNKKAAWGDGGVPEGFIAPWSTPPQVLPVTDGGHYPFGVPGGKSDNDEATEPNDIHTTDSSPLNGQNYNPLATQAPMSWSGQGLDNGNAAWPAYQNLDPEQTLPAEVSPDGYNPVGQDTHSDADNNTRYKTASDRFSEPTQTYEQYKDRKSESAYLMDEEHYAGSMGARAPAINTVTAMVRWSTPKFADKGFTPDPEGKDIGGNPMAGYPEGGSFDKDQAHSQSGEAQTGLPLAPDGPNVNKSMWPPVGPNTGPTLIPSDRAFNIKNNAGQDDDKGADNDRFKESLSALHLSELEAFADKIPGRGVDQKGQDYEPDRSSYTQSPAGQAASTAGYEEAYSSDRHIDYSMTGETTLGTVPVQGYGANPHGEMFNSDQWEQEQPGTGAADVANVPAPGIQGGPGDPTDLGHPQYPEGKEARLQAVRNRVKANLR